MSRIRDELMENVGKKMTTWQTEAQMGVRVEIEFKNGVGI